MRTKMDEEFLKFSQMLDEEENLDSKDLDEDGELLLELRATLREKTPSKSKRADELATRIRQTHQSLSAPAHLRLKIQNLLRRSLGTSTGTAGALLLGGLGTVAYAVFGQQLAILGTLLVLSALVWLSLDWRSPELELPGLHAIGFYGLPLLAMASTGLLAGLAVDGLGSVSATFNSDSEALKMFGWAAGLGIFALLTIALTPSWRAFRDNHGANKLRLFGHVLCYGAWAGILLAATIGLSTMEEQAMKRVAVAVSVWTLSSLAFVLLAPFTPTGSLDLKSARRRSWMSLVLGLLPIALCVYIFYQVHLTRELHHEKRYKTMMGEVENWYQEQMNIPEAENGWTEIKHFLLAPDVKAGLDKGIGERLSALTDYYDPDNPGALKSAEGEKAKEEFLGELPRLREALAKPHLSYLSTEARDGLSFDNLVPNFITLRAVSQGLAALSLEAVAQGNSQEAVDYTVTALEWSGSWENSALIGLMIELAMADITLDSVDNLLTESRLSESQLKKLSRGLEKSRPSNRALYDVMAREIYMVDKLLLELKDKGLREIDNYGSLYDSPSTELLVNLLPKSYIESERLAYLNLELAQVDRWKQLSAPGAQEFEAQVNPLNLASQVFVPNTARAQLQLTKILSKFDANRLRVALELYQRKEGCYPESLEALVPNFIDRLPKDLMNEAVLARKPTFGYRQTSNGYELSSESSCYQRLEMAPKQTYKGGF